MVTKAERTRLLNIAKWMVRRAGGADLASVHFDTLAKEFQGVTHVSRERARHYVAKAIRKTRAKEKEER